MKTNKTIAERLALSKKHKGNNVAGQQVNKKVKNKKNPAKFGKVNFNG